MSVRRLYTGPDSKSRVESLDLPEGEGVVKAIELKRGAILRFIRRSQELVVGWHNTPNPSYMIVLSGTNEVGIGDGSVHQMGPGDVLLQEDQTGQGHNTRFVPPFLAINVRLGR